MSQFGIVDRVDFFKHAGEMICFDLINVSTSKEKLQKNLSKLERKLNSKVLEKMNFQIKKEELENQVLELVNDGANDTIPSLIQEKETKIQTLNKNVKIPHDSRVQTTEWEKVIQEQETLESKLQNTKSVVGTLKAHNEEMEKKIQTLKEMVEQLSLSDPNFSLVTELGKLTFQDLDMKKLQESLDKAKQELKEKDKALEQIQDEKEYLKHQLKLVEDSWMEEKHFIWDQLISELKKLKDYLEDVEDERE